MNIFNLKKGFNIPVLVIPEQIIQGEKKPKSVAVLGPDYIGLKPKMLVSVGDKVKRGSPLFCHKDYPEISYVSPCKGKVKIIYAKKGILENVDEKPKLILFDGKIINVY